MVDKQVHIHAEFPDVLLEHLRIRRLEDDPLGRKLLQNPLDNVGPLAPNVSGDASLSIHEPRQAGLPDEPPAQVDRRGAAHTLQAAGLGVSARAELDAEHWLGREAHGVHLVD